METFAEKVKRNREAIGISQKELAESISVTSKIISGYERGLSTPRGTTAHKLARALNVSVDYLLNDEIDNPLHGIEKDPYVEETRSLYGAKAAREAEKLLEGNLALFAGGKLEPEEMDKFFEAVTKAYWTAKEEARKTYGRRYTNG
jgi:transcriptional regulator with XRE-family HTH domain